MKQIAVLIDSKDTISNIVEALKYYTLSNDNYEFHIFGLPAFLLPYKNNKFKHIFFIADDAIDISYLINKKRFEFILDFCELSVFYDSIKNSYPTSMEGFLLESPSKKSLMFGIDKNNISKNIDSLYHLLERIKNQKKYDDFAIGYIENTNFIDKSITEKLSTLPSFKGEYDIKNLFKCDLDILLMDNYALTILIDCLIATYDNYEKQKNIGSYFSKMFNNFPKNKKMSLSDNFFNLKIYLGLPTTLLKVNLSNDLAETIYLLKNLEYYENLSQ